MRYFRARHLAAMLGPVIEDGVVAIDGDRIVAAGRMRDINPPRIDEAIDGVLMPGLINAHTHLELTNVPRPATPGTFQDWLLATMAAMREADLATFNRKRVEAVHEGIAQCLKFGVTSVGDVSQNVDIVRPILAASPLRCVSYGECLGLAERRGRFEALRERAMDTAVAFTTPRLKLGVAPHAPYTVDAAGYAETNNSAFEHANGEWTTHLAETPDEGAFIHRREGPFRELYQRLGFDPGPPQASEDARGTYSPVEWIYQVLDGKRRALLAHVNYSSDRDLEILARHEARVTWCPRTHAYFGHPPHRWQEMLERGIAVCIATDSCASSPDLNLVDDLRLVHQQCPGVDPLVLWQMVTSSASNEFHWPSGRHPGWLVEDCFADFCAWPTQTTDPLREILDTPAMLPSAVWIGGEKCSRPFSE